MARRRYQKQRRQIILCQATVRRHFARKQYKKLKIEARSIEHVKKLNKGLENKIISLQQKIEDLNKVQNDYKNAQNEINDLRLVKKHIPLKTMLFLIFFRNKLVAFKALETEMKTVKAALLEKNKTIERLEEMLKTERDEKMDLINEQERFRKETEEQQRLWGEETSKLRKELDNINEIVKTNQKGAEENLKVRLEQEKMLIMNEQDSDRHAYQKLLQEYHSLEQHCENLEKELRNQNSVGLHTRNISDVSSISGVDETAASTADMPEDHGYGSVRSTASSHNREALESIDWKMANGMCFIESFIL